MLKTVDQLRAARVLARLDQGELAAAAGLHRNTVGRLEAAPPGLLGADLRTVVALDEALAARGVEVLPDGSIRLREAGREPARARQ